MNTKNFAQRFRELRLRKGWTQEEMATELGIGAKYLGMIETGKKEVEEDGSLGKLFLRLEGDAFGKDAGADVVVIAAENNPREKLRLIMQAKHISPAQLAKKIRYDSGVVENVVNGAGRISESMAERIEGVFGGKITKADLMEGSETPPIIDPTGFRGTLGMKPSEPGKRRIPLISWASAGTLQSAVAFDEDYSGESIETSVPGRAFSVRIEGDSMYPEISPGDIAVVRADQEARPGQLVLVRTLNGDVWCKRYSTRDGNRFVVLSSVNSSYQPFEIEAAEIAWIYPVKQVIRNYS